MDDINKSDKSESEPIVIDDDECHDNKMNQWEAIEEEQKCLQNIRWKENEVTDTDIQANETAEKKRQCVSSLNESVKNRASNDKNSSLEAISSATTLEGVYHRTKCLRFMHWYCTAYTPIGLPSPDDRTQWFPVEYFCRKNKIKAMEAPGGGYNPLEEPCSWKSPRTIQLPRRSDIQLYENATLDSYLDRNVLSPICPELVLKPFQICYFHGIARRIGWYDTNHLWSAYGKYVAPFMPHIDNRVLVDEEIKNYPPSSSSEKICSAPSDFLSTESQFCRIPIVNSIQMYHPSLGAYNSGFARMGKLVRDVYSPGVVSSSTLSAYRLDRTRPGAWKYNIPVFLVDIPTGMGKTILGICYIACKRFLRIQQRLEISSRMRYQNAMTKKDAKNNVIEQPDNHDDTDTKSEYRFSFSSSSSSSSSSSLCTFNETENENGKTIGNKNGSDEGISSLHPLCSTKNSPRNDGKMFEDNDNNGERRMEPNNKRLQVEDDKNDTDCQNEASTDTHITKGTLRNETTSFHIGHFENMDRYPYVLPQDMLSVPAPDAVHPSLWKGLCMRSTRDMYTFDQMSAFFQNRSPKQFWTDCCLRGGTLVVVPAGGAIMGMWEAALHQWAPALNVFKVPSMGFLIHKGSVDQGKFDAFMKADVVLVSKTVVSKMPTRISENLIGKGIAPITCIGWIPVDEDLRPHGLPHLDRMLVVGRYKRRMDVSVAFSPIIRFQLTPHPLFWSLFSHESFGQICARFLETHGKRNIPEIIPSMTVIRFQGVTQHGSRVDPDFETIRTYVDAETKHCEFSLAINNVESIWERLGIKPTERTTSAGAHFSQFPADFLKAWPQYADVFRNVSWSGIILDEAHKCSVNFIENLRSIPADEMLLLSASFPMDKRHVLMRPEWPCHLGDWLCPPSDSSIGVSREFTTGSKIYDCPHMIHLSKQAVYRDTGRPVIKSLLDTSACTPDKNVQQDSSSYTAVTGQKRSYNDMERKTDTNTLSHEESNNNTTDKITPRKQMKMGDRQNDQEDVIDLTMIDTDTDCGDERSNNVVSSLSSSSSSSPSSSPSFACRSPSSPSADIECQWILVPPETSSGGIHNDMLSKFIERIEMCLYNLSSTSLGNNLEEEEEEEEEEADEDEQREQRALFSSPSTSGVPPRSRFGICGNPEKKLIRTMSKCFITGTVSSADEKYVQRIEERVSKAMDRQRKHKREKEEKRRYEETIQRLRDGETYSVEKDKNILRDVIDVNRCQGVTMTSPSGNKKGVVPLKDIFVYWTWGTSEIFQTSVDVDKDNKDNNDVLSTNKGHLKNEVENNNTREDNEDQEEKQRKEQTTEEINVLNEKVNHRSQFSPRICSECKSIQSMQSKILRRYRYNSLLQKWGIAFDSERQQFVDASPRPPPSKEENETIKKGNLTTHQMMERYGQGNCNQNHRSDRSSINQDCDKSSSSNTSDQFRVRKRNLLLSLQSTQSFPYGLLSGLEEETDVVVSTNRSMDLAQYLQQQRISWSTVKERYTFHKNEQENKHDIMCLLCSETDPVHVPGVISSEEEKHIVQPVLLTGCGHYFCAGCLQLMLNLRPQQWLCPGCRQPFTTDQIFAIEGMPYTVDDWFDRLRKWRHEQHYHYCSNNNGDSSKITCLASSSSQRNTLTSVKTDSHLKTNQNGNWSWKKNITTAVSELQQLVESARSVVSDRRPHADKNPTEHRPFAWPTVVSSSSSSSCANGACANDSSFFGSEFGENTTKSSKPTSSFCRADMTYIGAAVRDILRNSVSSNEKALLFATAAESIKSLRRMLNIHCPEVSVYELTTSISSQKRSEMIRNFWTSGHRTQEKNHHHDDKKDNNINNNNCKGNKSIMLVQYGVGSLGVNLQTANHVLIVEPCVGHSIQQQAIGRVWRIGQKKRIQIHVVASAGTLNHVSLRRYARTMFSNQSPLLSEEAFGPTLTHALRTELKSVTKQAFSSASSSS